MAACEDCSPQHIRNEGHDESADNKECKHQKRLLPEAVIGIAACFEEVASVENPGGLISSQENVNRLTRLHSPPTIGIDRVQGTDIVIVVTP